MNEKYKNGVFFHIFKDNKVVTVDPSDPINARALVTRKELFK